MSKFRWKEATMIRQKQAEKDLKQKIWGIYVDSETHLLHNEPPKIPDSLCGVQRVEDLALVKQLCERETKATKQCSYLWNM